MNYMRTFLIVAAALLLSLELCAADVDVTSAQALAQSYLQNRQSGKLMAPGGVNLRLAHTERSASRAGSVAYYVFNADDAFVIVAGDDRAEPILARGDHALDVDNIPPNMRCLLDQYKAQIDWLAGQPPVAQPRRTRARAETVTVDPLVTCRWDQREPYYNLCPEMNGERCLTGCTATAMAQVMYYWKYPESLPELPGYQVNWKLTLPDLPATELRWDDMLDEYHSGRYTEAQADAVATLMRYCGQAAYMEYGPDASGASEMNALMALQLFGYNDEAELLSRNFYGRDQWIDMILEDLMASRPVLYYGYTESYTGHAFILDGYDGQMFHVNWGWGGSSDGYFALDALGTSLYEFNYYQTMQHGIYPDPQGGGTSTAYDFESAGIYYKQTGNTAMVVNKDSRYNTYSGTIIIPETVTYNGQTLTVTAIGDKAFLNCQLLVQVVVPSTVTSIGRYAFACSDYMETVRLKGGNKTFGYGAFAMCYNLTHVYVDDIESWLSMDFKNMEANPLNNYADLHDQHGAGITNLVVPGSMGKVKDYACAGWRNLQYATLEEGITSIGECAFLMAAMKDIVLPSTLRSIGRLAFGACIEMSHIDLPASLTTIGPMAFADCYELTHVDIPDGVTSLPEEAFGGCGNLTSVKLPAGLIDLGPYAFSYCSSLTSVSIPSTVVTMGEGAFIDNTNLTQVTFGDQLEGIPALAFSGCTSLQEVTLPESVTWIGREAFSGNASLTAVSIPPAVERIGTMAFKSCSKLARVDISDIASWCRIAFPDMQANPVYHARHLYLNGEELQDLAIPAGVKRISDFAFSRCESLTRLTVGDDVERIGEQAFFSCKQMTEADLGDGVQKIGEKAFNTCTRLKKVTFGSSVDSVGMYSFGGSTAVTSITSRAVTPPYLRGVGSFSDKVYNNAVVSVPRESLDAYREALVWRRFNNIQGVNFHAMEAADVNGDGEVTIADVNLIIDTILQGGASAWPVDVNGDGEVSVADINAVVNIILTGR
jgi:hypothetical protein